MNVAITGGTGFLGSRIIEEGLGQGHQFLVLTRRPTAVPARDGVHPVDWSPEANTPLPPHDAVFNLAGESISGYWTAAKKEKILDSRVEGTRRLLAALRAMPDDTRPQTLISASAVGYYGERGSERLTEESSAGDGYLADVCEQWETEARRAEEFGMRVAILRIGVVLGRGSGALDKILPPFRMGVGGPLGSGRQWFPWVHVDDVAGLALFILAHQDLRGPVNIVAPGIVSGKEFAQQLGRTLHRPALFPVPVFMLRLVVGEFAIHLVESQHVLPSVADNAGYSFRYPTLSGALQEILAPGTP